MTRLERWPDLLAALIASRRHAPFVWGEHDCALGAGEAVLATTGYDWVTPYRRTYSTPIGALRRLRWVDGVRLPVEAMDRHLGERRHPAMARLGDVVAWTPPDDEVGMGPALGVCYGRTSFFVGTRADAPGLVGVPTSSVEHCYNV